MTDYFVFTITGLPLNCIATPSLSTFHTLHETLRTYPTQLARSVTPFLYKSLESSIKASASTKSSITAGQRAEARVVYAKRHLEPNHEATKTKLQSDGSEGFGKVTGTALIDGIKATNEELLQHIHNLDRESSFTGEVEEMYSAYALFVSSQWDNLRDDHLVCLA